MNSISKYYRLLKIAKTFLIIMVLSKKLCSILNAFLNLFIFLKIRQYHIFMPFGVHKPNIYKQNLFITSGIASFINVSSRPIVLGWPGKVALRETGTEMIFMVLKELVILAEFPALFHNDSVHLVPPCFVTLRTPRLTGWSVRHSDPWVPTCVSRISW